MNNEEVRQKIDDMVKTILSYEKCHQISFSVDRHDLRYNNMLTIAIMPIVGSDYGTTSYFSFTYNVYSDNLENIFESIKYILKKECKKHNISIYFDDDKL